MEEVTWIWKLGLPRALSHRIWLATEPTAWAGKTGLGIGVYQQTAPYISNHRVLATALSQAVKKQQAE